MPPGGFGCCGFRAARSPAVPSRTAPSSLGHNECCALLVGEPAPRPATNAQTVSAINAFPRR
ncbi:hypothetical protein [Lentzea jiangxiensis]|uniref:hypothetical protein n=1 Tax=Lentzea jiangxiensis TaxID=641025 RepID=UPI0015A41920|nr:hypothetical protein [Lentzea jiangxiensis]